MSSRAEPLVPSTDFPTKRSASQSPPSPDQLISDMVRYEYEYEYFRAPRVARHRGVALVRPNTVREIAKSKLRNRELGIAHSRNREIAKSRNRGILKSQNREIARSQNRVIAESRIGIGNRNRKMPRQLESEIAIYNRISRSESEIANCNSEIESQTCHVRLGGCRSGLRRKLVSRRFDMMQSRL